MKQFKKLRYNRNIKRMKQAGRYDDKRMIYRDSIILLLGFSCGLFGLLLFFLSSFQFWLGLLIFILVSGGALSDFVLMVKYIKDKKKEQPSD